MRFKGKVAIVTGGSKGLGKVIAKQLAQEGASTVINGRDMNALEKATREIRQDGGQINAIRADVSNSGDVETMIDKVIEEVLIFRTRQCRVFPLVLTAPG